MDYGVDMSDKQEDIDILETNEWLDALDAVLTHEGIDRAHFLLEKLIAKARKSGAYLPYSANTAYLNTIPPSREEHSPGDMELEWRLRSIVRWNALAMVVKANRISSELGGHIASFASSATLYDVGFNHFFRAPTKKQVCDLVYVQGHSAPGMYSRGTLPPTTSLTKLKPSSSGPSGSNTILMRANWPEPPDCFLWV